MSDIGDAFADEPAFIPYLAVGDPDADASVEYIEALCRGGADVIELGLPFSEPIAEGPTIQNAVIRSLEGGMTPTGFFDCVSRLAIDVPLVCMTYYNLIYQFGRRTAGEPGPEPFCERAADVGIDGFVVPDLPAEEADPLRDACDTHDLDLIFIVAPTTRGRRLERIMAQVSGYVYVQARLGVTGARADVSTQTAESLDRLSSWDVPKAVGFGIESGTQARRVVAAGADGVIVGSALVDLIAAGQEAGDSVATVADRLEAKARELKRGALAGANEGSGAGTDSEAGVEARPERK